MLGRVELPVGRDGAVYSARDHENLQHVAVVVADALAERRTTV